MSVRFFILSFIFISIAPLAKSQNFISAFKQHLDTLEANYPQEKIFVHTDRSSYSSDESIWFKIYTTLDGQPSFLSKIIYVELVNNRHEVIEKRMLPVESGYAYGDIFIKKELPSGTYSLNAYTLWSLNFPETIFSKPVFIYNTDYKDSSTIKQFDFKINFFPEGGDLVENLNNRIAFKAISSSGLPLNIRGEILDENNNKVTSITTMHDGMGMFEMKPESNKNYKAVFLVNGITKQFKLPTVKKNGITIKLNNEGSSNLFFELQKNLSTVSRIFIVGRMYNTIVYSTEADFTEEKIAGAINKKNLPAGILQITIYNENAEPLAERLAFVNNYKLPIVNDFNKDSFSIAKRSKNKFAFNVSEFKNLSASVSVINYASDSSIYDDNLLTSLLLTSDIKGYINNPSYYFKDKNVETVKHLDLVMMTHGWRRLSLNKVALNQFPKITFPIESDITVKGKITRMNGNKIENSKLDFITKTDDSTTLLTTINLSDKDEFVLSGLNFKKGATIYYQGTNKKRENGLVKVNLFPSYIDTLTKSSNAFKNLGSYLPAQTVLFSSYYDHILKYKQDLEKAEGITLSEVVVNSKKLSPRDSMNKIYASDMFKNSDQTIIMDGGSIDVWMYLQSKIAGLRIGKDEFGVSTVFFTRDEPLGLGASGDLDTNTNIDFYLNEVKVTKDMIESIDPSDFVFVKVWKSTSSFVIGSERGAIALYTDKNKANRSMGAKGFDFIKKMGYSISREFYSLDYDVVNPASSFVDNRPTLYWNPNLKPDKDGNVTIKFFNDDVTRKFKITIQGIDQDGKIISIQKILE